MSAAAASSPARSRALAYLAQLQHQKTNLAARLTKPVLLDNPSKGAHPGLRQTIASKHKAWGRGHALKKRARAVLRKPSQLVPAHVALQMDRAWQEYKAKLLPPETPAWPGCLAEVLDSPIDSLRGVQGTVLRESADALHISCDARQRVVAGPKRFGTTLQSLSDKACVAKY
jgi:hypothetical protein